MTRSLLRSAAALLSTVYEEHKDSDGFLCTRGAAAARARALRVAAAPPTAQHADVARALAAHAPPADITYSGENTFGAAAAAAGA
jgi:hypothetical protein